MLGVKTPAKVPRPAWDRCWGAVVVDIGSEGPPGRHEYDRQSIKETKFVFEPNRRTRKTTDGFVKAEVPLAANACDGSRLSGHRDILLGFNRLMQSITP